MSEYDTIIRNGTVVDGTRLPAYKADVAIRAGKIAQISGTIKQKAKTELDASDCIVAPGALDLHTHYDAQICWDPYATLSGWHGVTTVCIGQCGSRARFFHSPAVGEYTAMVDRLLTEEKTEG